MNRMYVARSVAVALAILIVSNSALAWHGGGHERIARTAAICLPAEVPAFFREGGDGIAHCSQDPDLFKKPLAPPALDSTEYPEHFIDLELLKGAKLPETRFAFYKLCAGNNVDPAKVGTVPYAILEWTQRLTVAFAEYRHWPNDKYIQAKILVYAGILSHYSGDLCQPLHTTVDYDGRAGMDGKSPHSGIHPKVDALVEKLPANLRIAPEKDMQPFDALLPAVVAELQASHGLVDRVYELEASLPALREPLPADGPVFDFTRERFRAGSIFTARLFLTAWRDSANIEMPKWHDRPEAKPAPASQPATAIEATSPQKR